MPTKNLKDFFPGTLIEGRAEILKSFGWHFERNDGHSEFNWKDDKLEIGRKNMESY